MSIISFSSSFSSSPSVWVSVRKKNRSQIRGQEAIETNTIDSRQGNNWLVGNMKTTTGLQRIYRRRVVNSKGSASLESVSPIFYTERSFNKKIWLVREMNLYSA